jgi:hypothetical protein
MSTPDQGMLLFTAVARGTICVLAINQRLSTPESEHLFVCSHAGSTCLEPSPDQQHLPTHVLGHVVSVSNLRTQLNARQASSVIKAAFDADVATLIAEDGILQPTAWQKFARAQGLLVRFTIDPSPRRKYQIRKRLLRLLAGLPRPLQRLTIDAAAEAKVHLADGDCTGLLLYFIRPNDWGKVLRQLHIHVPIIERWAHLLLKLLPVELENLIIHTYSSRTKAQQQQDIWSPMFPEGLTSLQWNPHGSRIDATVIAAISTLRYLSITKAALCNLEAALEGLTGLHSLRLHQVRWPRYTSPLEGSSTAVQRMTDLRVLEAPNMWAGDIGGWMALSQLPSLQSAHLLYISMGPEVLPAVSCTQLVLGRAHGRARQKVHLINMLQADLPRCLVRLLPALRVLKVGARIGYMC